MIHANAYAFPNWFSRGIYALVGLILMTIMISCTEDSESSSSYLPPLGQYKENSELMINVANKFIRETDAKKLHEVVVATQLSRAMECRDFNKECEIFQNIMNQLIGATKDSDYSPQERATLERDLLALKLAVRGGIRRIQQGSINK